MASKKRNVIVGQSGGPTSVINSSLAGVYKNAIERGFDKVYGMLHGVQGLLDEQYVDMSTQIHSDLDIELLKRTPSAFLGSCRYKLPEIHENMEIYDRIFEILDKLEIDSFIYIGGNDSMDTIRKLSDYAIVKGHKQKFLGVPKTIDNDLALTDHTPGFGSAAKYIAASTKEVIRDALGLTYKKEMITVMEIMGRNAGWLTGAAALAKTEECEGPDLIYLPEIAFDVKEDTAFLRHPFGIAGIAPRFSRELYFSAMCSTLQAGMVNLIPACTFSTPSKDWTVTFSGSSKVFLACISWVTI